MDTTASRVNAMKWANMEREKGKINSGILHVVLKQSAHSALSPLILPGYRNVEQAGFEQYMRLAVPNSTCFRKKPLMISGVRKFRIKSISKGFLQQRGGYNCSSLSALTTTLCKES